MKNKVLYITFFLFIGLFIVFKPLYSKKFFGFEYEDSFVNSHVASQKNIFKFINSYRTMGCESMENGECKAISSYTGHYATYSVYLFGVSKMFNVQEAFLIHKVGNALLFIITFFLFFYFYKDSFSFLLLFLGLISCLPALYVFNSGLIENMSFALGLLLILFLFKLKTSEKDVWLALYIVVLIILVNVKRENLIFLTTLIIIEPKKLVKNYIFWGGFCLFLVSQIVINPFFTESLESAYLGRSTFSYDYFKFQFPTYLASFFRIDGFLFVLIIVFLLIKPTKESLIFLGIWLLFIVLYSFHYRGQYAIAAGKITHFESFRYMFNTMPLLIGYFLFGTIRNRVNKFYPFLITLVICFYLIYENTLVIEDFASEELTNYHNINEKLNSLGSKNENIVIHDNFVLISMLNNNSESIDVLSANSNDISFKEGKENILINRFKIINLDDFKDKYTFQKIDSLSNKGASVFSFKKVFSKNVKE
jgi:hypothetical protein